MRTEEADAGKKRTVRRPSKQPRTEPGHIRRSTLNRSSAAVRCADRVARSVIALGAAPCDAAAPRGNGRLYQGNSELKTRWFRRDATLCPRTQNFPQPLPGEGQPPPRATARAVAHDGA